MIRPPFGTRNITDNRCTCFHCRNSGIVALDQRKPSTPQYGAPCPMCERGERCGVAWAKLDGDNLSFWQWNDVTIVSWENGLTHQHQKRCRVDRCLTPSVDSFCDFHSDKFSDGRVAS